MCVQVEEHTVEYKDPKWRPEVRMWGINGPCQSEEGEPQDGSDQTIMLQEAVSFL